MMNHFSLHSGPRRRRGFTLVETLVAITILTLSILAPFDAVERVINGSRLAKDQLVASSLAQEAMEYVRFIRTSNYLAGASTLMDGINGTTNRFGSSNCASAAFNNYCSVDGTLVIGSVVAACNGAGSGINKCGPLYVTTAGVYTQSSAPSSNTATIFTRGFTYKQMSNYETVTVQVNWEDHGPHTMVLTENLYDWF